MYIYDIITHLFLERGISWNLIFEYYPPQKKYKSFEKIQILFKYDKKNRYFTRTQMYIYDIITHLFLESGI